MNIYTYVKIKKRRNRENDLIEDSNDYYQRKKSCFIKLRRTGIYFPLQPMKNREKMPIIIFGLTH